MPRTKRHMLPGYTYHVISRFVDRDWYIESQRERSHYLTLLGRALRTSDWRCLAYAVMSNHIHLALVAGKTPMATWLRRVHSPFADSLNRSRKRLGPIFTRGPKSILVPDNRVGQLLAYIHNNPVRAKLVASAAESNWTSHRSYLDLDLCPRWLDSAEGLRRANLTGVGFDAFVAVTTAHPVLGPVQTDEEFWQRYTELEIAQAATTAEAPPDPHAIRAAAIVAAAADIVGISLEQLRSARRGARELLARAVAIECGTLFGLTSTHLAEALHLSPQAVRKTRLVSADRAEVRAMVATVIRGIEEPGASGCVAKVFAPPERRSTPSLIV